MNSLGYATIHDYGRLQVGNNYTTNYNYTEPSRNQCIADLRRTDPRDDKTRIEQTKGGLLRDSYRWILVNADFRLFRDDPQRRLLWIKGDPGKGKTMLLCGIIDELGKQTANLVSYFFCQGTNSSLNNATAVLRGLIFLLAIQQPSLDSLLRKEYEHSGRKLFEDGNAFFALSKILSSMLGDPSLERTYIVIDALDECETGLQQLLKLIVQNTSASHVKWIVSSRNKHDIEQQLKPSDSKTRLSLELKANAEHVSHAVGVYIDDRVSQLDSLRNDGTLRDRVRRILRQKAGDTFLWAALVVQELKTVESWDVLDVLEEMPMGLEELYARMMKQIQQLKRRHPEYCRLVLSTATLAYRPLHILELSVLSGLPKDISGNSERVQTIIRMCGSFLTMRDDKVYIVHQSAKDYLSGKVAPISPSQHAEVDRKKFLTSLEATTIVFPSGRAQGHRDIFLRSVEAMSKTLKRDIYGLRDPGFSIDNLKIPSPGPLAPVRYSCVYWIDHLCEVPNNYSQSQGDLQDGGVVHEFLQVYLLYWIEALGLCGATSDAVFAVAKLERLLKTVSSESSLLSLTIDAHRFLLHNGLGIKNTPLQTYVSALLFSPTCSLTRKLFKKLEPEWVLTGPMINDCWSPLVKTLEGHRSWVRSWIRSVVFSPDGKLIASGADHSTIKIWDVATGEVQHTLEGHHGSVTSITFSPDGKLIASGAGDETIKIWDAATGEVQHTLKGHGGSARSITFSPDGKLIASGADDKTVKIWDTDAGEVRHTLEGHRSWIRSVAFSPDGKLIASGAGDKTVKIWDAAAGKVQRTLEGPSGWVTSVVFSPDGKLIASGADHSTIKIWDVATGEVQHTLKGHRIGARSVVFSSDGKLIASGAGDDTIKIWDVATGEVQRTLKGHGGSARSITFSPDQNLIASGVSETIKIWDVATGEVQHTLKGHGGWVDSVVFSPGGKLIASGADDDTIKIWDVATGEVQHTLKGHRIWARSVVFSPDGKLIASGAGKTVKIWDAAAGKVQRTLEGHTGTVNSVVFSHNGKLIASGADDETVKIWDADAGEVQRTLEGHTGSVNSVVFSHNGKLIASGANDKTIKIWDAAAGKVQRTLEGHSDWVNSVAFSPDGKLIASGAGDETVKIWDVATGEVQHTLKGHDGWVQTVSLGDIELHLLTDINSIKLDAATHIDSTGPIQSWSRSKAQEARQCGYSLSPDKSWITWNGHKMLWLPSEYRPSVSAICHSVPPSTMVRVAIGCESGRIIVIGFSEPPHGLPPSHHQ